MNRVLEKLNELSEEFHCMEIDNGVDFTDEEEKTWSKLTLLIIDEKEKE